MAYCAFKKAECDQYSRETIIDLIEKIIAHKKYEAKENYKVEIETLDELKRWF